MRRLLAVLIVVVPVTAAVWMPRAGSPPEGPVRVVTGEPVRVVLPANPTAETIEQRTIAAMSGAAESARDPVLRSEWSRLVEDRDTIEAMATRARASLSSGQAAALAFPMFTVDARSDRLTIVAMTIEIIPGRSGIALSRDHEDGHAEVNDQLALRCGPGIARSMTEQGRRGAGLEAAIASHLQDLADAAHEIYHRSVENARLGTHVRIAREASREVAAAHCG